MNEGGDNPILKIMFFGACAFMVYGMVEGDKKLNGYAGGGLEGGPRNPLVSGAGMPWWLSPDSSGPTSHGGGGFRSCNVEHTVARGETLFSIAQANGTTVAEIASASGISNPDYIQAGRKVCIR